MKPLPPRQARRERLRQLAQEIREEIDGAAPAERAERIDRLAAEILTVLDGGAP